MQAPDERNRAVAKRVALILSGLSFFLLFVLLILFGPNINTPLILGVGLFFLAVTFLLSRNSTDAGRLLLCAVPPVATLLAAVMAKLFEQGHSDILYFDARFILILFSVVPCLVFDTSERVKLGISLGVCFLALLLFDPVHEVFDVGYYQVGFTGRSYYYINYVAAIVFFGVVAGTMSLKFVIERADREIRKINRDLSEALRDVEAQNEEITAQSDELNASQEQLLAAKRIIEQQNSFLEKQVIDVNATLENANKELVRQNNELLQFSYIISHNLRGPIARLLGLTNIASLTRATQPGSELSTILAHIETSAHALDSVISDLGDVLNARNAVHQDKQLVSFSDRLMHVAMLLKIETELETDAITFDFSKAENIYTIKAMLDSILYNLISNALKYRSPDRVLKLELTTDVRGGYVVLEIRDNGLGIDLAQFGNNVFMMYKRFHLHQPGKGLGLYLTKIQAELLDGNVEIESAVNVGTTVRVSLKNVTPE